MQALADMYSLASCARAVWTGRLYLHFLLSKHVARLFEPFRKGFLKVVGGCVLSLCQPQELAMLVQVRRALCPSECCAWSVFQRMLCVAVCRAKARDYFTRQYQARKRPRE